MNIMVLPNRRATVMLPNELLTASNAELIEALTDIRAKGSSFCFTEIRAVFDVRFFWKYARGNGSRSVHIRLAAILSVVS